LAEAAQQDDRTVRNWRRLFTGFYLFFTVGATLCALLSILSVHCGLRRPERIAGDRISDTANKPEELRSCHRQLEALLAELHEASFSLQTEALKYKMEPVVEWRNWSESWRHRWEAVGVRCRLRELAGAGVSPALNRMEGVHAELAELQLAYSDVAERFVDGYVERLRRLRADLTEVRGLIDSQRAPARGSGGALPPVERRVRSDARGTRTATDAGTG
jgi:hypothetical protein